MEHCQEQAHPALVHCRDVDTKAETNALAASGTLVTLLLLGQQHIDRYMGQTPD